MENMEKAEHISYWSNRWKEQRTGWQINEVNPNLIKFLPLLTSNSSSKTSFKFFIPLSGQTYDIAYLLSLGHSVFCVEGVKEAIEGLNERDKLDLSFDPSSSTYKSSNGQLVIYYGDLFECPIENWGPFDVVWDRGSLIAVEYVDREKYMTAIKRSIDTSGEFRYLLEAVEYNKEVYGGPPRSVDSSDMSNYFNWAKYELLSRDPITSPSSTLRKVMLEGESADMTVYLISPK